MADVIRRPPYPPLFEVHVGLRLYYCARRSYRAKWSFGPAALSAGKQGFSFVAEGAFWADVNGERRLYRKNDLLALRPGDVTHFTQEGPRRLVLLGLGIECDQSGMVNALGQRDFPRHSTLRRPREFVARFVLLERALKGRRGLRDWQMAEALVGMVAFLLRETNAPSRSDRFNALARCAHAASAWAMENLGRAFSTEDWARAVGVSASLLDRAFRRTFGRSARRWLEDQRMQTACRQLLSTARSVKEVAFAVGYEDPFYFSRVFHRRFHRSPRDYRREGVAF